MEAKMTGLVFESAINDTIGDLYLSNEAAAAVTEVVPSVNPYAGNELGIGGPILLAYNGVIYINGLDAAGYNSLFVYNLSTNAVSELNPTEAWSSGVIPQDFSPYNGEVYFNGVNSNGDQTLWMSDGSATNVSGAHQVDGSPTAPDALTVYGNQLFFNGTDASNFTDLFAYNGTSFTAIAGSQGLNPNDLAVGTVGTSQVLFMSGTDAHSNRGLFTYNNSTLTEVYVGNASGGVQPEDVVGGSNGVFFSGIDGADGNRGLWVSDGTTAGTKEVASSSFGATSAGVSPSGLDPYNLTVLNGELYFTGNDNYLGGSPSTGRGLFVYDPATNSTQELIQSSQLNLSGNPGPPSVWGDLRPDTMTAYDGNLYFDAADANNVPGLYEFNTTTHVTTEIAAGIAPYYLTTIASDATSPSGAGILESLTPGQEIDAIYVGYFDRAPDAGGSAFGRVNIRRHSH
jgi:ELWxxDGT repeat protein